MVAVMTDLLDLKPDDVVLEIGTGLGHQSAVIAELAGRVYTVELIDELAQRQGSGSNKKAILMSRLVLGTANLAGLSTLRLKR